jgi:hypothetical protein
MKKQTTILILAIVSFLLCGFTIRLPEPKADDLSMSLHVTTTVNSNGSGRIEMEITLSKDLLELLERADNFNLDQLCEPGSYSSTKLQFTQKSPEGGYQCIGAAAFEDLNELESLTEDELGASVTRLEIKKGRFYYDVSYYNDFSSSSQIDTEVLWILVLPGTPGDTNADKTSGRTLTWDLTNSYGSQRFKAESGVSGGFLGMDSSTLAIVAFMMMSCCCCAILLLAAGIVVFLMLRKKNPSAVEESSPDTIILGS